MSSLHHSGEKRENMIFPLRYEAESFIEFHVSGGNERGTEGPIAATKAIRPPRSDKRTQTMLVATRREETETE